MSGFAAGQPEWRCPKCEGDGFVLTDDGEAVACECRAARVRRARSRGVSSVIPRKYRGVSFDRAPVTELDPTIVREVKRFVRQIDRRLDEGRGLWFMGDVGTGKTTLAMLVSKAALDTGRSAAIYSVPNLLAAVRDTYESATGERSYLKFFRDLVSVDLLHLDDLGAEKQTEWVLEQLYSLVNERYVQEKSIIVTSNIEAAESPDRGMTELEKQLGKRTVSRLLEMTDQLPLFGADLRERYDPASSALG
jgi:DNA replication protein DnaC